MRYKILNILALVTLASCTETIYIEKDAEKSPYLNGECKTPIAVGISYNEGSVQTRATRATNGSFTQNDNLIAFFRHVTANESTSGGITTYSNITAVSETGIGPAKANMTIGSIVENKEAIADNYSTDGSASSLTLSPTLYWDDFSNSASTGTDLRTSGHYLQSYYGYCYNGKTGITESETTPTSGGTWLKTSTGELTGWTIETDQNTNGLTKSDLLWSSSQDPVPYKHATFNGGVQHGEMKVPYSHAMSKVTIEVNLADGFGDVVATNFPTSSKITLNAQTKCSVSAPATTAFPKGNVTPSTTPGDITGITMKKGTPEAKKCTFEAIIAPTVLTPVADVATASSTDAFATIEGIDGNKYDIFLTDAIMRPLQTDNTTPKTDAWSTKLAAANDPSVGPESTGYTTDNGGTTIPGVNYKLVVTISKQEIKVVATIADWTNVEASAKGEINFTTDIAGPDENTFETTFDLYSKSAVTTTETYNNLTTNNRNTVCTWDDTNRKWTYDPTLYWEKEGDNRYFRAVSPQVTNRAITPDNDNPQTVVMTAGEGTDFDFCWGTTQAYTNSQGQDVEEGNPVEPRTSNVGLQFYHKTSKVKIVLQTPPTDAEGKVVITNAKIQFTNLYTTNTVNLHSGVISTFADSEIRSAEVFTVSSSDDKRPKASAYTPGSPATASSPAVDDKAETAALFMIPQEIPSDNSSTSDKNEESRLIITLTDGTTYSLALNSCKTVVKDENGNIEKDENGNDKYVAVGQWEEGKSYVYYIRLTKEEIQFIALIQNWDEKETNGSATMDWDDVDPDLFEGGLIEKRGDGWKIQ